MPTAPSSAAITTSDANVSFQLRSLLRAAAHGLPVDRAQAREMLSLLED